MTIPIIQIDAFTNEFFSGNPAAVCLLEEQKSARWMLAVAAEMNLSETAFVLHNKGECNQFSLRWFTPRVEVPLCGHATLASAHVLWEKGIARLEDSIVFHSSQGFLTATREDNWIKLDFPALPGTQSELPVGLVDALGVVPSRVYRNRLSTYLVELDSEQAVRELEPDTAALRNSEFNVCIVTARGVSNGFDFVSRFFAPGLGIDEDPVTGSAHCFLGPYWADRLGKIELVGHQVSKRGGVVKVRLRGDRVDLLGQAVTVLHGELAAPSPALGRRAQTSNSGANNGRPIRYSAAAKARLW
jgi:PhzF family phenazine biosynthesis protein